MSRWWAKLQSILMIRGRRLHWSDCRIGSIIFLPNFPGPTGALDYETGKVVLAAIARVNSELGTTTVIITHNSAIAGMADRVLRLGGGRIVGVDYNEHRLSPEELSW